MSRRRSSPSRSDDDDSTPPRGTRVADADADADADLDRDESGDDEWDDGWQQPNYLIRRALVVAGVVLAIAVIAVVASRFIGGHDGGDADSSAAEWNTTVVLARNEIRLLDRESGEQIDTFDSAVNLLDAQSLVAGDVLVTMTNRGAIELIDLDDGSSRRGRAGRDETLIASFGNPRIAIAGPDAGGDATIIDTVGRRVFSVAEVADLTNPLIFSADVRVNRSGSHVAVPVPNAFQSFVIDVAQESSQAFAGRVIAISDELIVTEQPAGPESEIEFYELTGDRSGSVDVPAPRASLLTDDGSLVLVAADGSVRTVAPDGTVEDMEPIIDGEGRPLTVEGGFAALGGTRLVVSAEDTVVVLDEDGTVLGSTPGQAIASSSLDVRCVIMGSGRSTDASTVLDLTDGSVVATVERGIPAAASADGCTVALLGTTENLLTKANVIAIDARSIAEVAPDGDAVIVMNGRVTELVPVPDGNEGEDGEDGDQDGEGDGSIELADEPVVVRFGQRE